MGRPARIRNSMGAYYHSNIIAMSFSFDKLPKFCINLERSHDRRRDASKQFENNKIKNVKFFKAIDRLDLIVPETSPKSHESNAAGILACASSHIAVIKYAKRRNLPMICVFEDDVIFCKDFAYRMKYLESLDFNFDVFSLGGHYPYQHDWQIHYAEETEFKHIYKTKELGGTYAYIIKSTAYDFLLRNWWFGLGADEFFTHHIYKNFNCYAMSPFMVGTFANKSDISGAHANYENVSWFFSPDSELDFSAESVAAWRKEFLDKITV